MDVITRSWAYVVSATSATHPKTTDRSIVLGRGIPAADARRLYGAHNFSPVAEAGSINPAYTYTVVVGNRPPVAGAWHAKRLHQQEPVEDDEADNNEPYRGINPSRRWPKLRDAMHEVFDVPRTPEDVARDVMKRAAEIGRMNALLRHGIPHSMTTRVMMAKYGEKPAEIPDYESPTRDLLRHPGHESPENPYSEPSGEGPESI